MVFFFFFPHLCAKSNQLIQPFLRNTRHILPETNKEEMNSLFLTHVQNKSEYHRAEEKRKSHQTKITSQQILCYLFLSMKITISPWTKFVFTQLCPSTNIGKYPPVTQSEAATENTQRKASFCLKTSMATLNSLKHVAMSGTT